MTDINFNNPSFYRNRELSWVEFDARCLSEARDKALVPLFERLKFLSITASNLDEFFMIRVASLKDQVHAGYEKPDIAGLTPKAQLAALSERTHEFVREQYSTYNRSLLPALKKAGLEVVPRYEDLTEEQSHFLDRYFMDNIYPVLTPMAVDTSRPFPLIRNKTLNIGALVAAKDGSEPGLGRSAGKKKKSAAKNVAKNAEGKAGNKKSGDNRPLEFATVQVPSVLPRIVALPDAADGHKVVILLEEVIERYIGRLFQHYDVICAYPYRIMRNADFSIDEDEAEDLLKEIEKLLKKRQWGEVIRLEVPDDIDKRLLSILVQELEVGEEDIFRINGPLDLTFLMKMYGMKGFDDYKAPAYKPAPLPELDNVPDIFTAIRRKDILMHHPYTSFDPVVRFVQEAAKDPAVLAIKQTLYRVSGDSPIVAALAQAADNGKQVSVLVELKARFDEEHNIEWAKMLEKAGCHVIYGLVGLKTHSKITMVVRSEEDGIRRYVHLGTGNYNDSTARIYTDFGLFTCDEAVGEDATAVFNMLSGYSEPEKWNRLLVAPLWMKDDFVKMIERETAEAKAGREAYIQAKINSLCDPVIMAKLYEASNAGVRIDLLVRGICCLKVNIPGISDNIHVRSIVGDFLEHSRVFRFCDGGRDSVYMGSADWMPRNLDRRVEVVFPITDEDLKREAIHVLETEFADNVKAHILQPDGRYEKVDKRGRVRVHSQEQFCKEAWERVPRPVEVTESRVFIPAEPVREDEA
ncbi:MAG: RNA degradosome polyphosphate kinase [Lachnospiraceae bacterium]|nr:RNA degradosome polyphosphate kinase [Lachnospiraceae bacterium]